MTFTIRNLSFRYATDEPMILDIPELVVSPGECVAIVGPSGCGKTTLLKIMQGILVPTLGEVSLGGLTLKQIGLQNFRSVVATVMQDDQLFAGSIYDNICFLDPLPNAAWLEQCAKTANIHDEIMSMAMGLGDMGTVLSGGQKQRVLLARALYRKPKILFLDEATSHLDVENESKIGEAIANLSITRIMVAHRPQTIAIADRIVRLDKGTIRQTARIADDSADIAPTPCSVP